MASSYSAVTRLPRPQIAAGGVGRPPVAPWGRGRSADVEWEVVTWPNMHPGCGRLPLVSFERDIGDIFVNSFVVRLFLLFH